MFKIPLIKSHASLDKSNGIYISHLTTFLYNKPKTSSSNGISPHNKQYKIIPHAQISAILPEYFFFIKISGSTYQIVPLIDFINLPIFSGLERPKSAILIILSQHNKIFSNFKSQCVIPFK